MLYGTGCDEAVLTYVPQDSDGVIRAHMWIGGGHHSCSNYAPLRTIFVGGFPGSALSFFPDAYSVIFFDRIPSLPLNHALPPFIYQTAVYQWFGDILVVKHVGHDPTLLQSMSFEEKALVDAFLIRFVTDSYFAAHLLTHII
jgi:hypothetical protein